MKLALVLIKTSKINFQDKTHCLMSLNAVPTAVSIRRGKTICSRVGTL